MAVALSQSIPFGASDGPPGLCCLPGEKRKKFPDPSARAPRRLVCACGSCRGASARCGTARGFKVVKSGALLTTGHILVRPEADQDQRPSGGAPLPSRDEGAGEEGPLRPLVQKHPATARALEPGCERAPRHAARGGLGRCRANTPPQAPCS
ncbi:hypothetical protein NDU88_002518 [Pleurodeles waltl]|uniref:Uncharacterized protein n=1 Tax=Pleurodeles waltl TaxID=8319 RepID=A0AAV7LCQ7_PLEWA|nr:hypothetical protein NDU88_002518 [Pleurodeles waltl]